ncbi:DMT family transporter [Shimia ponticola]|uniref:DMT family transporter n=1 Tax=Shimia ponticola TaxID=2582893 RepID=UPI0011BE8191|nr:DMT family transporter [Shimia ponticola]
MSANVRATLLALLAFGIFSTHDVIVKTLGASYSPFQVVFFSVLFGFPIATVLLLRDNTVGTLIPKYPMWTVIRTLAAVITGASAFYAFSVLPLAQTYAIIFASPLLITIMAIPILGEKVGLRRGLAVLVGLAGVLVVLQPGATELTFGHLAALCCAIFGALASVIVRKIGREERSIVLILYPMVANFVIMAVLLPFVYQPMPVEHLGLLFLISLFATVAGLLVIQAYRLGEAVIVAPMQYSQILWATLYGALFFGEQPEMNTAIGAAIIIASGVYIVLREGSGKSASTQPVLRTRSRVGTPTAPRISSLFRLGGEEPPNAPKQEQTLPEPPQEKPAMRGLPGRTPRRH